MPSLCTLECDHGLQNAKCDRLEQRIEVLVTERDDAKILAKELKVQGAVVCSWKLDLQIDRPFGAALTDSVLMFCSPKATVHKAHQKCSW